MTSSLTIPMLGLILLCILVETGRELCFKRAASSSNFLRSLVSAFAWAGIALWAVELVVWTYVLAHVPLSIAFPLTSINYVIIVLGGAWLLKESVSKRHLAGALLITAGVAIIGASGV